MGDKDVVGRDGEEGGENVMSDGVVIELKMVIDVVDVMYKKLTAAVGFMDAEKLKRYLKSAFNKFFFLVVVDKFVE